MINGKENNTKNKKHKTMYDLYHIKNVQQKINNKLINNRYKRESEIICKFTNYTNNFLIFLIFDKLSLITTPYFSQCCFGIIL